MCYLQLLHLLFMFFSSWNHRSKRISTLKRSIAIYHLSLFYLPTNIFYCKLLTETKSKQAKHGRDRKKKVSGKNHQTRHKELLFSIWLYDFQQLRQLKKWINTLRKSIKVKHLLLFYGLANTTCHNSFRFFMQKMS